MRSVLNLLRRPTGGHRRTAIVAAAKRCTIATVNAEAGGRARVESCIVLPGDAPAQRAAIAHWFERERASAGRVSCVLEPSEYQMLLVEAPDVLPAELKGAVRWRLKDLLDFPVADAAIDVLPIPDPARRRGPRMLYVVAARRHAVDEHVAALRSARADLDVIDIPELALRNLAVRLPVAGDGLVLLWSTAERAQLCLIKGEKLYLTRQVRFSPADRVELESGDARTEAIALELQRSLDYFESHYEQTPPARLLVAPADGQARRLVEALAGQTALPVELLDPRQAIDLPEDFDAGDRDALVAVGAALRGEPTGG
ncbi:MAG: hypothetical protein KGL34_03285 [Gammaproteobacteria bacterium]|nr:hypothetical protein [Gammaproteobacteria bacterium]